MMHIEELEEIIQQRMAWHTSRYDPELDQVGTLTKALGYLDKKTLKILGISEPVIETFNINSLWMIGIPDPFPDDAKQAKGSIDDRSKEVVNGTL